MAEHRTQGEIPAVPGAGPELRPGASVRSPRGRVYLLGDRLGDGSFGEVFDCLGPFDEPCALKVFRPERGAAQVREQWLKEAQRLHRQHLAGLRPRCSGGRAQ